MFRRVWLSFVSACALVLLVSCGGASHPAQSSKDAQGVDSFGALDYVPDDAPYALVMDQRFDTEQIIKLQERIAAAEQSGAFAEAEAAQAASNDAGARLARAWEAVVGNDVRVAEERTGWGTNARAVIYGDRVLPVARAEIDDANRFITTLQQVLVKAQLPFRVRDLAGHVVVTITEDPEHTWVVGALSRREVVGAVVAPAELDRRLEALFSGAKPARSIRGSGRLRALLAQPQAGRGGMVGFADTRLILEAVGGLQGACSDEAHELAALFPGLEASFIFDGVGFGMDLHVLTSPALADALSALRVEVPGMGVPRDPPAMMMGIALDLPELDAMVARAARAVMIRPFRCQGLAPLNQLATRAADGFLGALPPFVSRIRGAVMAMDAAVPVNGPDGPDTSYAARAVLLLDDPDELFAQLVASSPDAAGVLPRDGGAFTHVRKEDTDLSTVRLGDRVAIGLNVEDAAVDALLRGRVDPRAPLFMIAVDMTRLSQLSTDDDDANDKMLAALATLYRSFRYDVHIDDRGLAFRLELTTPP